MNIFLTNNNYRKFSTASFLSSAGDILFYLAFMTYASKLRNYSLALSLIAISESLPKLFTIFGGYFADRTRNKFRNIFLAAIIRCVLYTIVGFLFISNVDQWNLVIIVVIINLISDSCGAYSSGLVSPLIVDLVGKDNFGEAEGFTNGVNEIINIAAQFIGSALLLITSYSSLAFINALSFLLAGILFANVGLKQNKVSDSIENREINTQPFFTTIKSSFKQVKKQVGLFEVVLIVAILNGSLSSMGSLIPIMIAANKNTMVISRYSFTIALMGVVVACGAALGSIFGTKLFKKFKIFSMTILATLIALITTFAIFATNIYLVLGLYFLLALTASATSIKLTQWLVTAVEHKILASTVGLLNTILIASAPLMTTVLTTVSGATNIKYALILLVTFEVITFVVELKVSKKVKTK
ncbi:MFS transporter [Lactobacillus ultunensis]|uniref:MFS transporter n=1 Tax=Lactobacillus ultunensis TaxID=227945 RepID=UPI0019141EDC|nr:MFS transporter [Lactobacillus ultunensis]QQP29459.1 MFS transporter [Lactobacillus ultunensis]